MEFAKETQVLLFFPPPSPKKNQFPFGDWIMEVRCKGLNIVITIIIIIKRPLLKPLRAVLGNMKYSDSKEPDIPYHKKKDLWLISGVNRKQQLIFHRAVSPSTFTANQEDPKPHLSAPHRVQNCKCYQCF